MMVAALQSRHSGPARYSESQRTAVSLLIMAHATSDTSAEASYFHMPLHRPGTIVEYAGKRETVGYVVVRRSTLLVHLVGIDTPVDSDKLTLAPSRFSLRRVPDKPVALISASLKP